MNQSGSFREKEEEKEEVKEEEEEGKEMAGGEEEEVVKKVRGEKGKGETTQTEYYFRVCFL